MSLTSVCRCISDIPGPYAVRLQATVPGTHVYEYSDPDDGVRKLNWGHKGRGWGWVGGGLDGVELSEIRRFRTHLNLMWMN